MTSATVAGSAGPVVKGVGRSHSNYSPGNVQPLNLPITSLLSPSLTRSGNVFGFYFKHFTHRIRCWFFGACFGFFAFCIALLETESALKEKPGPKRSVKLKRKYHLAGYKASG